MPAYVSIWETLTHVNLATDECKRRADNLQFDKLIISNKSNICTCAHLIERIILLIGINDFIVLILINSQIMPSIINTLLGYLSPMIQNCVITFNLIAMHKYEQTINLFAIWVIKIIE